MTGQITKKSTSLFNTIPAPYQQQLHAAYCSLLEMGTIEASVETDRKDYM